MSIQDIDGTKGIAWTGSEIRLSSASTIGIIWEICGADRNSVLAQSMLEIGSNNQGWYWSDAWQRVEKEADDAFLLGDVETFDNMDDFINTL